MKTLANNLLLGVPVSSDSKQVVLEKIIKYLHRQTGFFQIVSLNPENLMIARQNEEFKKVLVTAQIRINDGIGIVVASRMLGIEAKRITGVGLMEELMELAGKMRLRVLLIGGRPNLALRLAQCYQRQFPEAKFFGTIGIKNIQNPSEDEEKKLKTIVGDSKPSLIFVSFGSPAQELWIERHSKVLSGSVVMGVGGAFDFLSGKVNRAPAFLQKIGLEWLYRLVRQPWRWRRQTRLIKFIWLVMKQKFA